MKRLIDVFVSFLALIILSPIIIAVGMLVAFKLGRPIIFTQLRPGKRKKGFMLYKFRSMTNDKDIHGNLLDNEARITNFGKWIRKSSLDELPSLWNVLKGDMSLVGPRPLRMRYNTYYTPEQDIRHNVKPGITGLAQIKGRTAIGWDEKFNLDVQYVNQQSTLLDLYIIAMTIKVVLRKENTTPYNATFETPFDEYMIQKNETEN